ncbi:MAG: M48 metallopeptidase family protein [Acidimicrobiales bacterium]
MPPLSSQAPGSRPRPSASSSRRSQPSPHIQLAYSIPVPLGQDGVAKVEIRVSNRRAKSSQAHLENGKVVVVVPSRMTVADREEVAARLALRMLDPSKRRRIASDRDLERRAHQLADRYLDGVRPASIRWVTNQARRWGSCTPSTGTIRLSSRLRSVPDWVLDAVIVHELAHLLEASHSRYFNALVERYERHCEADAYLLGFEHGASTGSMPLGPLPEQSWASDDVVDVDDDQLSFR